MCSHALLTTTERRTLFLPRSSPWVTSSEYVSDVVPNEIFCLAEEKKNHIRVEEGKGENIQRKWYNTNEGANVHDHITTTTAYRFLCDVL